MGGSPCTKWSIAQTKDRETEPAGIGWELFKNYLIARDKYKPDYFLYENNKSMAPAIKDQITKEFGVEPTMINSSLVSAQNRQRLYWFGKRNDDGTYIKVDVEQPEDRGILLKSILDSGVCWREKAYTIDSNYYKTLRRKMVTEQVYLVNGDIRCLTDREMDYMVRQSRDGRNHFNFEYFQDVTQDKGRCLTANVHKGVPYNVCCEPVRIGTIENDAKNADFDSQQYRVYSPDGKSVTLCGQGGGVGAKTGLYATPIYRKIAYETDSDGQLYVTGSDGKNYPVYKVDDGFITIKGDRYPIGLQDGLYIIRKLTVNECKRLQTVPDWYIFPVSNTQAYKLLGNGWTCDVISHLLSYVPDISSDSVEVLSMYDGMSCGQIALKKLGAHVQKYYATEVDKYAIKTTQENFPSTIQLGDAFQVREECWSLE